MNPPSKKWMQTRNAALEGAHYRVFEPIKKLLGNSITVVVVIFVISYMRFNFFEFPEVYTSTITAVQVVVAGISMISLPILLIVSVPVALLDIKLRREVTTTRANHRD